MQKSLNNFLNRAKFAIAVVIAGLLAAGGLLALRSANAPAKEAAAGTRARNLDAGNSGTGVPPVDHAQDARATFALQQHVPRALKRSRKIHRQNSGTEPLTLTIVLKRADQPGF